MDFFIFANPPKLPQKALAPLATFPRSVVLVMPVKVKGLEIPRLIGLVGAAFIHTWRKTRVLLPVLKQDKMIISKEYTPLGAKALILIEHT